MRKIRDLFILLFTAAIFYSCSPVKFATGTYRTNFPVQVMFSVRLKLNTDSTFEFVSQGDLSYDSVSGTYRLFHNKVFLLTIWTKTGPYRYTRAEDPKIFISGKDTIKYQSLFYIGTDKLYFTNLETGKKITKAKKYHPRKKWILFGNHYYNEKWYLERRDAVSAH